MLTDPVADCSLLMNVQKSCSCYIVYANAVKITYRDITNKDRAYHRTGSRPKSPSPTGKRYAY